MHRDVAAKEFPIFSLKLFWIPIWIVFIEWPRVQYGNQFTSSSHISSHSDNSKIWYKIKIFAHIARKDCTIPNLSLPSVTVSTCWDFLITNIRITFLMSYFTIDLFFMIALLFTCWGIKPFEAPQRSVKIKIKLNFFSLFVRDWDGRVNLGFS